MKHNIPKVVIGCRDPFAQVNGKGIEKLLGAGIEVIVGVLENKCIELNKRFFVFHKERRPYVVLKWAQTGDETTELKILDVGTGSGCIALALKKAMPKAEVWACDISDDALSVARRNGSESDIRVDFVGLNFLNEPEREQLPTANIVVSNPPYIPLKNKETMHRNVVEYEPHTALFVPNEEAVIFYKALAEFGKHRLYKDGNIYAEIHEDLSGEVLHVFKEEGYLVELRKDMQGKDRMVKAWLI